MAFALCPDEGPPRIWRFREPGVLPSGMISRLDPKTNVLEIDKAWFATLTPMQRRTVERTHALEIWATDDHELAA